MGRKPAGLGNEIFGLAKAILGTQVFGGELITPDYSNSMHEYPKTILENFRSRRVNITLKNRINVGDEIFAQLGNRENLWDYKILLKDYAFREGLTDGQNLRIQHSSKMVGGFLAIRDTRETLRKLFEIDLSGLDSKDKSVSLHLRVPDISDSISQRILQRQIEEYYKPALRDLYSSDGAFSNLNLITNANSENSYISDLTKFAKSLGFRCNYDPADSLTHLKLLAKSNFIIPSVSTFSLLGIFLSNAKYFWPSNYTSTNNNWRSIWGHEKLQILGPTYWFRELNESHNYNPLKSRGMIHGFFNPYFFQEWIKYNSDYELSQDLIYYGSTSFGKEVYK
ncbi:MAG: hypothetical protein EBU66_14480 [Bacteroidetes bacterium]|nr:hypothetical protein [bacterium]NBP65854.1 hypothetical protein [Bacteroidota bacterium]